MKTLWICSWLVKSIRGLGPHLLQSVSLGTAMPQIRVIWVKAETSISVLRWWSLRTQSTSANAILYSQIFQILIFKQNTLFGLDGFQRVHCGHKFTACKSWPNLHSPDEDSEVLGSKQISPRALGELITVSAV